MTFGAILRLPARLIRRHLAPVMMVLVILLAATLYPSDMKTYYATSKGGQDDAVVVAFEAYGRHVNTVMPFATAIVLRDWTGLRQLGVIVVVGILASHGPKRLLNDVEFMGTRLGQRPYSPDSSHNMPSGHSTLASAGAYFMMRRYSIWFALIVLPVMLLTMYARFMLDAHTISATIAGAATGMLVTALFSTKLTGFHSRMRALISRTPK